MSEKKTVSVRIGEELHAEFKEMCKLEKMTMQAVLMEAIVDYIKDGQGLKAVDFDEPCAVEESEV